MEDIPSTPGNRYTHPRYTSANPSSVPLRHFRPTCAQKGTQFILGLTSGLLLVLFALLWVVGKFFWATWMNPLMLGYIPLFGLFWAIALIAIKPSRWFGIGLIVGVLIYIMGDSWLLYSLFSQN
ncbi:MAG TPA: hypothetical protein VH590_15530 [Ktedonobacterales bacterium]|jgi:hypothetical protein